MGWTPGRNVEGLTESARGRGALNPQPYTLNPKVDKQAGKQAGPEEETEGEVNSRTDGFTTKEAKMYRQHGAPFLEILHELVLDGRDRKGGRKIGREWEREVCASIVTNRKKSRLRTQPCFQSYARSLALAHVQSHLAWLNDNDDGADDFRVRG